MRTCTKVLAGQGDRISAVMDVPNLRKQGAGTRGKQASQNNTELTEKDKSHGAHGEENHGASCKALDRFRAKHHQFPSVRSVAFILLRELRVILACLARD
jgi:hypothetical protein